MNQTGQVRSEQATLAGGRDLVAGGPAVALLPAGDTPAAEAPATVLVRIRPQERGAEPERWAAGGAGGGGGDGAGDVVEESWQRAEREQGALYG